MRKWFLIVAMGISLLVFAILVKCTAARAEDFEELTDGGSIMIDTIQPSYAPMFFEMVDPDGSEIGRLTFGKEVTFEGKADESAKEFIKYIKQYLDPYLDERDRDISKLLTECLEYIEDGSDTWPTYGTSTLECRPLPGTISEKEDEIKRAQKQLDRLKAETALHKRIEGIIKQLTGKTR